MLVRGYNMAIALGTSDEELKVVAASKSCTLSINKEMIEKSPKDAGYRSYIPGMSDWNISAEGLYSVDNIRELEQKLTSGTCIHIMLYADTEYKNQVHKTIYVREKYYGEALIQSLSMSGSIDGFSSYTIQIQGNGKLWQERQDVEEGSEKNFEGSLGVFGEKNNQEVNKPATT